MFEARIALRFLRAFVKFKTVAERVRQSQQNFDSSLSSVVCNTQVELYARIFFRRSDVVIQLIATTVARRQ
jgi:hypothetical protein